MLFGRRKPGYTTTVDANADPEQVVLDLQKAEMAAKKKPKAEVFDINAASETARRLKETGSTFDGAAAKAGEDVIAVVERETGELAAKQAAENASAPAETPAEAAPDTDSAAKPELLDFLAAAPEAENDPYADQPTQTAPELPELTPAQELAGYIRSRSRRRRSRPTPCWSRRWKTPTSCWPRCRRTPSARISLPVQAQRIPTITPTPT